MSWDQFVAWMEFSAVEPFGERRRDSRAGIVAATIANVNVDPRSGRKYSASDFMPDYGKPRKPLTDPDEWKSTMKSLRSLTNAPESVRSLKRPGPSRRIPLVVVSTEAAKV